MTNILEERPFAGNWSQDILNKNRKIITWTPDAIVLLNGDTKIAGCNECKNKIDFQAFITSVSVNAGVSSGDSSSSIEMSIPSHYGDSIFKDGEFLFSTGVEVNVYYRGFFEIEGHAPQGDTYKNEETQEKYELDKVAMRPYYPVFHGVVTSVSFNFSGGFYSASLSCNGLLHFWQNQKVNTNAAYLAATPAESRGSMRLDGHVYTNMTPHQIIYDLYRDSGGSAGDAEWVFSSSSNQNNKTPAGRSQFSDSLRYWENRFAQGMYSLRMYGASGSMFSSLQTAFIGDPSRGKKKGSEIRKIIRGQYDVTKNTKPTSILGIAQTLGIFEKDDKNRFLRAADFEYMVQLDDTGKGGLGLLATELKAFITDIGALGNVELFSSSFESKQSIADTVAEKIGYEFYQDVDGDLVFKPPFYNLDTSSSRIYRIKREDVLDISFQHEEPQYTYAICKSGMFRNTAGLGMEGTWGVKGTYVDYRLVAKYGWKPLEFDSTFFNKPRQNFFAAVVELEKANTNINGCSLSIPLRPELKAGYPVYIEHIDCFYYVTSISHSFSFGGDCTTGLTLTARRKKFLPPGDPTKEGIGSIRLDDPLFPPKALISKEGDGVHYNRVGFPNVVMALDPYNIDPASVIYGLDILGGASSGLNSNDRKIYRRMLIKTALNLKVLRLANDKAGTTPNDTTLYKGPWVLMKSDGSSEGQLSLKDQPLNIPAKTKKGKDGKNVTVRKAKTYTLKKGVGGELGLRSAVRSYNRDRSIASRARKKGLKNAQQLSEQAEANYQKAKESLRGGDGVASIIDLIEAIEIKVKGETGLSSGANQNTTASILATLSNKKASFNPNQPGYYRYYSSSHPNPEHQGPPQFKERNITSKSKNIDGVTGESTEITLFNQAIDKTEDRQVANEVTTGSGNRVIFQSGRATRGLLTRTRYTSQNTEVIPTKDILFLSFQEHGWKKKRTGFAISVKGQIKGSELYSAIKSAIIARVTRACKGKTVASTVAKDKLILKGRVRFSPTFKNVSDLALNNDVFTGNIDDSNRKTIITSTTKFLMNALASDHDSLDPTKKAYTENMDRGEVKKIVLDVHRHVGAKAKLGKRVRMVKKLGFEYVDSWMSPIFPVSDEQGYELFGAYQYGRGLNIVKGASFDSLLKQDKTRILDEGDVDSYLQDLHSGDSSLTRDQSFKSLSKKLFERLEGSDAKLEKAFNRLTGGTLQGQDKKKAFIEGVGVALMTQQNDQVIANVPARLSEIRPETRGDAACDCRGDTSDVEIFLADEGNFLSVQNAVDIDDSEIVTQYKNEIEGKVDTWKRRQDELSGEIDES